MTKVGTVYLYWNLNLCSCILNCNIHKHNYIPTPVISYMEFAEMWSFYDKGR